MQNVFWRKYRLSIFYGPKKFNWLRKSSILQSRRKLKRKWEKSIYEGVNILMYSVVFLFSCTCCFHEIFLKYSGPQEGIKSKGATIIWWTTSAPLICQNMGVPAPLLKLKVRKFKQHIMQKNKNATLEIILPKVSVQGLTLILPYIHSELVFMILIRKLFGKIKPYFVIIM